MDKARAIFYKALQNIPWVKVRYIHIKYIFPFTSLTKFDFVVCLNSYFCCRQMCGSGSVYGCSPAVPRASAGVHRSDDGERAPTEAAFGRAGHSSGGLIGRRQLIKENELATSAKAMIFVGYNFL